MQGTSIVHESEIKTEVEAPRHQFSLVHDAESHVSEITRTLCALVDSGNALFDRECFDF